MNKMICNLCPRRCNALRNETENKTGFCKMPLLPKVARAALHFGEEPIISGKKGSGTVFFSGCSLSCVYCQNSEISALGNGKSITVERLAQIFYELEQMGANNINLVTPTHYAHMVKRALDIYRPSIPIVYNSSGYECEETLDLLKDYIDIYLFDFKYWDKEKAKKYSNASDYPEIVKRAILKAYSYKSQVKIENGIMQSGVIIRHLLLPLSTNDAIKIFDWIRENTPNVYFSIMSQYVPLYKAKEIPEISRPVTKREYEKVISYILNTDFKNVFIQERNSATEEFIPDFDFTGV